MRMALPLARWTMHTRRSLQVAGHEGGGRMHRRGRHCHVSMGDVMRALASELCRAQWARSGDSGYGRE